MVKLSIQKSNENLNKLKKDMKKYCNHGILIMIIGLLLVSCSTDNSCVQGSNNIVTKEINIEEFTGVDLKISNDVIIKQGPVQKVSVTGNENVIALVGKSINSGVWDVELLNTCYLDYQLQIEITVPNIEKIFISGSGDIRVEDFVNQNDMSLKISGSGDITMNKITGTQNLIVKISGSGDINLQDDFSLLKRIDISMSGSGNFLGFNAFAKACYVSNSGSGKNEVYATEILDVSMSGSGNTYYKGTPQITKSISGSGAVINAN